MITHYSDHIFTVNEGETSSTEQAVITFRTKQGFWLKWD